MTFTMAVNLFVGAWAIFATYKWQAWELKKLRAQRQFTKILEEVIQEIEEEIAEIEAKDVTK